MTVTEAVRSRRSTPAFDASFEIDAAELASLMEEACLAPSALNLQPWRFVVCSTEEAKRRLCRSAFGQEKIVQASAVVAVFGDLLHHRNAPDIATGNVSPEAEDAEQWIDLAVQAYENAPRRARDEAFRGGSLWAMTFALLCVERGWDTSLIGGFDEVQVREAFGIDPRYLPILLVAVGRAAPGRKARGRRLPLRELLLQNSG